MTCVPILPTMLRLAGELKGLGQEGGEESSMEPDLGEAGCQVITHTCTIRLEIIRNK